MTPLANFKNALAEAAVSTAKTGVRVYPENGKIRVRAGTEERRAAAKAVGAVLAPDQPSGDSTDYVCMPTCILLNDCTIPLVSESMETVDVPEGYEVWEATRGSFWGDDRDVVYRLRRVPQRD